MKPGHEFVFDPSGARDLLRGRGLTGAVRDPAWQVEMATALLVDAQVLLSQYGFAISERAVGPSPDGEMRRAWVCSRGARPRELWLSVGPSGEWLGWIYTPAEGCEGDYEYCEEVVEPAQCSTIGVTFDHVTREVLGAAFARSDGAPFRDLDHGAGAARRLSPLETIVEAILRLTPR